MKIAVATLCLIPFSLALGAGERSFHLFTAIDAGRLENGNDMRIADYNPSGLTLNRTYVDVGYAEQLDDRYFLSIGVGGIFWKAFESAGGNAEDKVIKFGPGISNAYMKWAPSGNLDLTFGYFPYKYNDAAKNLGEYLFRTEAYPTIVFTGGWSWMNDAQYRTVGAKLTYRAGSFKQDLGLFAEYFNSPIYDITPAYIATWKGQNGITLGGAASLHRFICPTPKVRDELTQSYRYYENFYLPERLSTSRYKVSIQDYPDAYTFSYSETAPLTDDAVKRMIWAKDSVNLAAIYNVQSAAAIPIFKDTSAGASVKGRPGKRATMLEKDIEDLEEAEGIKDDSASYFKDPNNAGNTVKSVSFDNAAVKLVAFFNLDFNTLLGLDEKKLGAFSLYGEIAQLGLKNYPIFYTESAQRRPMMLGASIPTFLLDELSVEVEYLKNPNIESIASTFDVLDLPPEGAFRYQTYAGDDYKWSVHASKKLNTFLTLYAQVANDHMRLKDGYTRPEFIPITNTPSHWYWLMRIQWMI
ncbi:MAG TPA: hypothetical protein VJ385_07585 [Fibrobacteria bacterium]|nr:hypothetical protein [Fibrobacteria bacterium]